MQFDKERRKMCFSIASPFWISLFSCFASQLHALHSKKISLIKDLKPKRAAIEGHFEAMNRTPIRIKDEKVPLTDKGLIDELCLIRRMRQLRNQNIFLAKIRWQFRKRFLYGVRVLKALFYIISLHSRRNSFSLSCARRVGGCAR